MSRLAYFFCADVIDFKDLGYLKLLVEIGKKNSGEAMEGK